jgi:hypothetical protein
MTIIQSTNCAENSVFHRLDMNGFELKGNALFCCLHSGLAFMFALPGLQAVGIMGVAAAAVADACRSPVGFNHRPVCFDCVAARFDVFADAMPTNVSMALLPACG